MLPASTSALAASTARRPPLTTVSGRFLAPGRGNRQQIQRFSRRSRRGTESLDYMHARFRNPQVGRFLKVDPKPRYRSLQQPQRWNRYAYALGNPLRYLDRDGREEEDSFFDQLRAFFRSKLDALFPAPRVDPSDPNIQALQEIGANPNLHPQNQAALVQEGLNEATANLAAAAIFTGLKAGEATLFARVVSGFSVGGSALLERGSLKLNISVLGKLPQGGGTLRGLLGAFESEAGKQGARQLVTEGRLAADIFKSSDAARLAGKLGYTFKKLEDGTILLTKAIPK